MLSKRTKSKISSFQTASKLIQNCTQPLNLNLHEKIGKISPFLQKKIDVLSTSRFHRNQARSSFIALSHLKLVLTDLVNKRSSLAFRKMYQSKPSVEEMLAVAVCSDCKQTGLSLLTTSSQGRHSPRFLENVKKLLPPQPSKDLNLVETPRLNSCVKLEGSGKQTKEDFSFEIEQADAMPCPNLEHNSSFELESIYVPRLNFRDLHPHKHSFEVLTGSPVTLNHSYLYYD